VRANTGSKHNLRNPQGKRISPKWLYKTGFYLVGGVGGFLYVPKAKNNFSYQQDITSNTNFTDAGYEFDSEDTYHKLRPLHTEFLIGTDSMGVSATSMQTTSIFK
jgi:hypothetical protein